MAISFDNLHYIETRQELPPGVDKGLGPIISPRDMPLPRFFKTTLLDMSGPPPIGEVQPPTAVVEALKDWRGMPSNELLDALSQLLRSAPGLFSPCHFYFKDFVKPVLVIVWDNGPNCVMSVPNKAADLVVSQSERYKLDGFRAVGIENAKILELGHYVSSITDKILLMAIVMTAGLCLSAQFTNAVADEVLRLLEYSPASSRPSSLSGDLKRRVEGMVEFRLHVMQDFIYWTLQEVTPNEFLRKWDRRGAVLAKFVRSIDWDQRQSRKAKRQTKSQARLEVAEKAKRDKATNRTPNEALEKLRALKQMQREERVTWLEIEKQLDFVMGGGNLEDIALSTFNEVRVQDIVYKFSTHSREQLRRQYATWKQDWDKKARDLVEKHHAAVYGSMNFASLTKQSLERVHYKLIMATFAQLLIEVRIYCRSVLKGAEALDDNTTPILAALGGFGSVDYRVVVDMAVDYIVVEHYFEAMMKTQLVDYNIVNAVKMQDLVDQLVPFLVGGGNSEILKWEIFKFFEVAAFCNDACDRASASQMVAKELKECLPNADTATEQAGMYMDATRQALDVLEQRKHQRAARRTNFERKPKADNEREEEENADVRTSKKYVAKEGTSQAVLQVNGNGNVPRDENHQEGEEET